MPLGLIQDSGQTWVQRPMCGWITIQRVAGQSTLTPWTTRPVLNQPVAIQTPTMPDVEVSAEEVGPLAEVQSAVNMINSGFDQLAAARTPARKRLAVGGLENQVAFLQEVLMDYKAALPS